MSLQLQLSFNLLLVMMRDSFIATAVVIALGTALLVTVAIAFLVAALTAYRVAFFPTRLAKARHFVGHCLLGSVAAELIREP